MGPNHQASEHSRPQQGQCAVGSAGGEHSGAKTQWFFKHWVVIQKVGHVKIKIDSLNVLMKSKPDAANHIKISMPSDCAMWDRRRPIFRLRSPTYFIHCCQVGLMQVSMQLLSIPGNLVKIDWPKLWLLIRALWVSACSCFSKRDEHIWPYALDEHEYINKSTYTKELQDEKNAAKNVRLNIFIAPSICF